MRKLAATRPGILGICTSEVKGELCSSCITGVDPRSRVSSRQLGQATRKLARSLSQPNTGERQTRGLSPSASRIGISGHHDGGAGATEFGQIAICSGVDVETRALPPNDGTIKIRLR